MPSASEKQRQAAGSELSRRRRGVKKQNKRKATRPFGTATIKQLKDFARK